MALLQPLQFNPISWADRQDAIGVTYAEWGTHSDMSQGITPCTWSYNSEMPLGQECSLPDIPSINHDLPPKLSISSSPQIRAILDSVTELDKQINNTTKVMEERAKQFLEEQSKQTEKIREQNKINEARNDLLRTKKQDIEREIAELKERQSEKRKMQQETEKMRQELAEFRKKHQTPEKMRQETEKMRQELAEFRKMQQTKEQLCNKLDNTMDYCIIRRGHQGKDIDSDWVCIGTTYILKKVEKCE